VLLEALRRLVSGKQWRALRFGTIRLRLLKIGAVSPEKPAKSDCVDSSFPMPAALLFLLGSLLRVSFRVVRPRHPKNMVAWAGLSSDLPLLRHHLAPLFGKILAIQPLHVSASAQTTIWFAKRGLKTSRASPNDLPSGSLLRPTKPKESAASRQRGKRFCFRPNRNFRERILGIQAFVRPKRLR